MVVVSILLGAGRLSAEEARCPDTDTPRQCLRRVRPGQAAVEAIIAAANSGPASPRVASAVKDFVNIGAAHTDVLLGDEQGELLAAAWNLPPPLLGARWQAQLEAAVSSDRDLRPALAFGPVTHRFGRRLAPHRQAFESMLLPLLAPETGEELGGIAWTGFDVPFDRIVEDAAARAEVIGMFALAARSPLSEEAARFASDFATVLQNQPQLYASGSFHDPRDGPRVWQAAVTWELGTRNLNGFRAGEGKACSGRDCAIALSRYLEQARDPGRLALSLAYKRVQTGSPGVVYTATYGRTLPPVLRGKEGRIDVALSYDGTHFTGDVQQPQLPALTTTRAPVPRSYDRFTVSGTYTQKLSNRLSLPLSVVWSERSESEPGDCRTPVVSPPVEFCEPPVTTTRSKWIVHVGLTYRFPRRVPEWRPTHECFCPEDVRRER